MALERQVPRDASAPPPTVVVVGSFHYDIMVDAPDRPRKGETIAGRSWAPELGGKGGNQAVARAVEAHPLLWSAPLGTTVWRGAFRGLGGREVDRQERRYA